jgi:oligopeptide/dipeptide ABC transporter ATP-binding protein
MSYSVKKDECVAIIGESGSGKTVSALSILRLIPFPPGIIVGGEIRFDGEDILKLDDSKMKNIRGKRISMIFQEPSAALDPVFTVGDQIREALRLHTDLTKIQAHERAIELLRMLDIPDPERRVNEYPHQFSGGMQQRAMIAMAMCCEPDILIADEPTTALDVTVQAQVLEQLDHLRRKTGSALILITHNLGVVAHYADSVKIMYGGKIVEDGPTRAIFKTPHHPYTLGLIRAVPRLDRPQTDGLYTIQGEPPDMRRIPENACAFAERCAFAEERCGIESPSLLPVGEGHRCACFNINAVAAEGRALI